MLVGYANEETIGKHSKSLFLRCFPNDSLFAPTRNICGRHKICVLKAENASEIFQKHFFASWMQFCFCNNVPSFAPAFEKDHDEKDTNVRCSWPPFCFVTACKGRRKRENIAAETFCVNVAQCCFLVSRQEKPKTTFAS